MSKPISKIREYMGLADIDYLSARILCLNGLFTTGLSKGAEGVEKQFKLCFLLHEKITNNHELSKKELRAYGHNLIKMNKHYWSIRAESATEMWNKKITTLQRVYELRYPEHWEKFEFEFSLDILDLIYISLRNHTLENMPAEYKDRAMIFGTFLRQSWDDKDYIKIGTNDPIKFLDVKNKYYENLNIVKGK